MEEPVIVSDKFWINDISILFRTDRLLEFFISSDQTLNEKLNAITRFSIYASVILAMYQKQWKYLSLSLLGIVITYFIYISTIEEEQYKDITDNKDKEVMPTLNNPFGNSSIMDIIDNPERPPMADYSEYNKRSLEVKDEINKKFNYNLFMDLDDLYGRSNSQRQFYTTPSRGTIPADPDGKFKNWLYGVKDTCKTNTYECGKNIFETPRRKRHIYPVPEVNPINTESRKN